MLGFFMMSALLFGGAGGCDPLSGVNALIDKKEVRWLVVGEVHGSDEVPAAFGDLVCAFGSRNRKIVVGLELDASLQPAIDEYMAASNSEPALRAFLNVKEWKSESRDGRHSQAMVRLLERLWLFKRRGIISRVVAILPQHAGPGNLHEAAMAENVVRAVPEGAVGLFLVGNLHAKRASGRDAKLQYMAMRLPSESTLSLFATGNGGQVWGCFYGSDQIERCGATDLPGSEDHSMRGVAIGAKDRPGFDGVLNVGAQLTASPPS